MTQEQFNELYDWVYEKVHHNRDQYSRAKIIEMIMDKTKSQVNKNDVLHSVVCSTRNTPAYVLDNIKFELDGNEFLIFRIAHKVISTKGQIFYNGELGYVLIKNGQTMMRDEFDETMINTMLRWNLIPKQ